MTDVKDAEEIFESNDREGDNISFLFQKLSLFLQVSASNQTLSLSPIRICTYLVAILSRGKCCRVLGRPEHSFSVLHTLLKLNTSFMKEYQRII
jgi:hypothetical protein